MVVGVIRLFRGDEFVDTWVGSIQAWEPQTHVGVLGPNLRQLGTPLFKWVVRRLRVDFEEHVVEALLGKW